MKAFRFIGLGTAMVLGLMALAWQEGTPPPRPPEPPRPDRPNRPPPTPVPPPMTMDADIERLRREAQDAEASGNAERAKELKIMIQKLQDERARRQDRPNAERDKERMNEMRRIEEELRAAGPDSPRHRELQQRLAELRGPGRMPGPDEMRKQTEDLMEFIKKFDPETAANLQKLVAEGRLEDAFRMAQESKGRSRELKEMQERDPEGYKKMMEARGLERECEELGQALRKSPADKKAEIKGKLEKVVSKLFDLREDMRAKELEDLKKRIDELNGLLAKRKASRDKIVERRVRQLSGEPDELDW